MKSKYFVIALLATLGFLTAVVASTSAATFINNLTAGGAAPNSPINLDPGWLFWVQSDTVSGDAMKFIPKGMLAITFGHNVLMITLTVQ